MALGKTVEQLKKEISTSELEEWKCFYELEPFGERLVSYWMSRFMCLFFNANAAKGKKLEISNFYPHWFFIGYKPVKQSIGKLKEVLMSIASKKPKEVKKKKRVTVIPLK